MTDQIKRMLENAKGRINDAEVLTCCFDVESDAPAMLNILALEVLLKAAQALEKGKYQRTHDYSCLWRNLSEQSRNSILDLCEQSSPNRLIDKDLDLLLRDWEFVFTKGRYSYELYENYTLQEVRDLGDLWIDMGAPEDKAEIRYHPEELNALNHGLVLHIENALR